LENIDKYFDSESRGERNKIFNAPGDGTILARRLTYKEKREFITKGKVVQCE